VEHRSLSQRRTFIRSWTLAVGLAVTLAVATEAIAQTVPDAPAATGAPAVEDDDAVLNPAEPDFVVVNLPTTLRLPLFKGNFRLTHRFAGNLRNGSFSEQAGNLFGIDQGAIIGFEYRMAVAPHVQAAFYRTSFDKTIQLHGKYDAIRQRSMPVALSLLVSIEGTDNFQDKYAPAVGVAISRHIGTRLAGYVTPIWVHNTAASLEPIGHTHNGATDAPSAEDSNPDNRNTTYVGLGGRARLGDSAYVAAEVAIRAQGYAPDQTAYGVSVEKRVGAHMFSLTFTNTFGTTFAQVARGGAANTLFLGFNLARKFF
jgi:uncharacterized beta barrel domain-containing protein DUF5777